MQCLMRRRRQPDWPNYITYESTATKRLASGGKTVGLAIDEEQDVSKSSMYSRTLRNLIAECLLLTPANRPPVEELVKRTQECADTMQMSKGQILGPPPPQWQEPVVSAEWFQSADPLAAAMGGLQVQSGNRPSRPPVKAQPAPSAQATTAQASAAPVPATLVPAGATQAGGTQAGAVGTVQAGPAQAGASQAANSPLQSFATQLAQAAATQIAARPVQAVAGSNTTRNLRVIVQIKGRFGGIVAGSHKTFILPVNDFHTVYGIKDLLEQRRCGIMAKNMNLMAGRKLMKNYQKLSEFPGVDNIRAMEA